MVFAGATSRRIGTIASQSEYAPLRIVQGTNGSNYKPWADILYDYFLFSYAGNKPAVTVFDKQNEPANQKTAYGVYVRRGTAIADHRQGKTTTDYEENYVFQVAVRKKSVGELFPELEHIISEVKRIFIEEYESHAIAGIRLIDNLSMGEVQEPETRSNPFQNIWLIEMTVTLYYTVKVLLSPDSFVYNAHKYNAGAFRKTF